MIQKNYKIIIFKKTQEQRKTDPKSRKPPREFRIELHKIGWSKVTVTTAGEERSSREYLQRIVVGMKVHVISWKQDTAETWEIGSKLCFFFSLFSFL
jgi:hypothetical protein